MKQKIDRFILLKNTIIKKLCKDYDVKKISVYLLFGLLTTLINISIYSLCIKVSIPYLVSNAIAFIISIIFAYITNKKWVFNKQRKKRLIINEFTSFLCCRITTFLLESVTLYLFISIMKFNKYGVKILVNTIVIVLNYILSEFIVFQKERIEKKG
ncbi:GtrA family protein [Paramaledivibacter caminithermalis]|jgi:putative flippase GtrA|uniref:Putative flippase GtrA (Transmembrane translocase of bactoprenol-linked glucose) n=1 Tax=Paramaledivibacter caminithermalis (strain DSM 15212 / CIP 107654 / DViRD3) TaxID=1121301 RepID=A0A1M6MSM6_PARC5|nr:GtrA family protein [Paramaledivibacter caminithermalis]SHJ86508.1 Putative flippase GtrA (transmembrane translocase of bactoprenol-linked glucose) [Paramaledivibacter caminithermalis DSM 15212]